jgi:endonuclease/exonuclease/phosphatase family metal-dependent hydrolase
VKLKVAAWNMAHWTHRRFAEQAWDYLDKEIAADITLLQECVPPKDRQKNCCVWSAIGGKRQWGSGVLTIQLPIEEVRLDRNDYPGALTVAEVTLADKTKIIVVSMYGQLDGLSYSITTLHRMLSDLTHLFNGELRPGGRPTIILGGDLNASVQFDPKQKNESHRIFFQRLEDFGLVDCQGPFNDQRQRTLRHSKSGFPWVNDYIFASATLAKKVVSRQVVEQPEMLGFSDHNPVVVTFEL